MKNYTFEQLPSVIAKLEVKLDRIETLLLENGYKIPAEDDYIGAKEACRLLKLSLPTLYTKVCHRELPFYKKGNRLHFSRTELLDWIKEGKKKSITEINKSAKEIAEKMEKRKWY
ncbi:DNA binding domain-containing protein, excisionase family [Chryseobacterium rhizoplanae]|uniref:DNA binding domain-containing protein, excisionase family n=1 Tax=Chryseobacterium rhizoplanae TaxID=1609531 RepID=A0A521DJ66_9FLAO|nr:helix-turn-helix domain-containing protein [Chryseobacterium rhizoplanae]SMO71747.1 DNA binding domain-containing protein, excisionase family [Chryseobacterium rhizoplanae]